MKLMQVAIWIEIAYQWLILIKTYLAVSIKSVKQISRLDL
jgi:hypothetical protein